MQDTRKVIKRGKERQKRKKERQNMENKIKQTTLYEKEKLENGEQKKNRYMERMT